VSDRSEQRPGTESGPPLPRYCRAVRFPDERGALRAYGRAQELLFASRCDLSAYRFLLDDVPHVAVVGDSPPPDLERQLMAVLAAGELTALPSEIVDRLVARRAQASHLGSWVEGHYRPGKHL
jgi:hypothetical protein